MDVFITLLSLGINGYKNLISQRKEMYNYLKEELGKVASKHGEKILDTKNNPISIGKKIFKEFYTFEFFFCKIITLRTHIDLFKCSNDVEFPRWYRYKNHHHVGLNVVFTKRFRY